MKLKLGAVLLFALATGAAAPALAWGPEGHSAIGQAALARLNTKASANVAWIIAKGVPALNAKNPGKCQIDPKHPFTRVDPQDSAHTDLGNWTDCYRDLDKSTSDWHYDDIPLKQNVTSIAGGYPWCKPKGCVSKAFAAQLKILADPHTASDPAAAARALAFVIHFMGDMHQPLHAEDNLDVGGNSVQVTPDQTVPHEWKLYPGKFHGLWDSGLVRVAMGDDYDAAATLLQGEAAKMNLKAMSVSGVIAATDVWIADAHAKARDAYAGLKIPFDAGSTSRDYGKGYAEAEATVAHDQLINATARLTVALNAALTWKTPA